MTVNEKGGGSSDDKTAQEVNVITTELTSVGSIKGCPLLANELSTFNFDTSFCNGLRLADSSVDLGARGRRILQTVPSAVVRQLKTILTDILRVNYKQHGTFRFAGATYVTAVRRSRDPHVSQAVHRDVQIGSPPGYLSIFVFLDNTENDTGGLEIWENLIDTVLDARNTNRDLRKCRSVRIPPKKGTLVVFDGRLAHRGIANTSKAVRVGIHVFAWPDKKGLTRLAVMV
jgi:hypothetical protein